MDRNSSTKEKNISYTDKRYLIAVTDAEYVKDYTLKITFRDGMVANVNFEPTLHKFAIYHKYLDVEKFKQFKLNHGCLEWKGNVLDFHYGQIRKMALHD